MCSVNSSTLVNIVDKNKEPWIDIAYTTHIHLTTPQSLSHTRRAVSIRIQSNIIPKHQIYSYWVHSTLQFPSATGLQANSWFPGNGWIGALTWNVCFGHSTKGTGREWSSKTEESQDVSFLGPAPSSDPPQCITGHSLLVAWVKTKQRERV